MRTPLTVIVAGVATLASAAAAQVPQRLPPTVTSDTNVNSLTVQNQRRVAVTIYLEHGQFDRRLGVVPAFQTATLPLPGWMVSGQSRVQLFAHPDGNTRDLASQTFRLQSPGRIGMIVPPSSGQPQPPADTMTAVIPTEQLASATLTVDNPRGVPVTVYAAAGQYDVRLGHVPAHGRATLRFPKSAVGARGAITIFVRPDGGADLTSETLQVREGQHLGLRVPPP